MKYKKLAVTIISLVLIWVIGLQAYAAKTPTVYAGPVAASAGQAVFIPIQIKNNPGLMGFRLTVTYDAKSFAPRAVSRGTVTENGMLEDSLSTADGASFDILWNDTKEAKEDGTLAVIGFTCAANADGTSEIKLSVSQEDTFNEAYEDVSLACESVTVDFSGEVQTSEREDRREVTPEDIVLAVETVQGDPQITPTNAVMDSVNSLLSQITGNPEPYFNSPDEITVSYNDAVKETFAKDVLQVVEAEKVVEIVQNALDLTGAGSIEEIPEDMRIDFINNVESSLKDEIPDVKKLSDYISQEDEIPAIIQLYENAQKEVEISNSPIAKLTDSFATRPSVWIACVAGGLLIVVFIIFLILKKHRKTNKKKN